MNRGPTDEIREFWDAVASDWQIQVGDDGDANRRLNSDPVLWELAGDVEGLAVLDAGCGTGYLSRKLRDRGARVVGVDVSPKMIEIARAHDPEMDFRVDSASELSSIESETFDLLLANYVLMDVEDLEGAVRAFHRVLKSKGAAVVVFSHPCFPQGRHRVIEAGGACYEWRVPYFERSRQTDPPWKHFTSDFIWFHRPLSVYFKAFRGARFWVTDFEEPRIAPEDRHLAGSEKELRDCTTRPYSVAFRLVK